MKRLLFVCAFVVILHTSTMYGQSPDYPYGFSLKTLFIDYESQNGGSITEFKEYHSGFEVGFHKQLQSNFNLVVPVKFGVVRSHNPELGDNHKKIYSLDGQIQYLFYRPQTNMTPYLMAGVGGVGETDGTFNVQVPVGAGLFFRIADNAYFNWQSEFRYSLEDDRNNLHHGLGFVYLFGKKTDKDEMPEEEEIEEILDSDGDGLADDVDLCPQVAGPEELKGCPDRDGDGIPDYRDNCPSYAGLEIFKGCPDTDADGISDNDDECPNMAGPQSNRGCPDDDRDNDGVRDADDDCPDIAGLVTNNGCPQTDTDGDGIPDANDACPTMAGKASASGCPDADGDGVADAADKCPSKAGLAAFNGCPDTDGDGLDDSRDKCPTTPGSVANAGCPEIAAEDRSVLELAMRAVQFDVGRATIKSESFSILNQIAGIMEKYPDYNLAIEGHTDNTGSASNNQVLSERRAKACFDYLVTRGIPFYRMSHAGYGETKPISDNNSLRGRALNRRVEFNLKPR